MNWGYRFDIENGNEVWRPLTGTRFVRVSQYAAWPSWYYTHVLGSELFIGDSLETCKEWASHRVWL